MIGEECRTFGASLIPRRRWVWVLFYGFVRCPCVCRGLGGRGGRRRGVGPTIVRFFSPFYERWSRKSRSGRVRCRSGVPRSPDRTSRTLGSSPRGSFGPRGCRSPDESRPRVRPGDGGAGRSLGPSFVLCSRPVRPRDPRTPSVHPSLLVSRVESGRRDGTGATCLRHYSTHSSMDHRGLGPVDNLVLVLARGFVI